LALFKVVQQVLESVICFEGSFFFDQLEHLDNFAELVFNECHEHLIVLRAEFLQVNQQRLGVRVFLEVVVQEVDHEFFELGQLFWVQGGVVVVPYSLDDDQFVFIISDFF
jgi:hypothetical protein